MKLTRKELSEIFQKHKIRKTIGKPKSNWRVKIYPKPTLWITKDTLKELKK